MATRGDWELRLQESDRRFYRDLNEIRLNWGMPPITHPSIQAENEENDRTIFIKIHLQLYLISGEILDRVFSRFGEIEITEIFGPPIGFHSKVRFRHKESAIKAFNELNERNIYDRCCQLELFLVEESKGGLSSPDSTSNNNVLDVDSCDQKSVGIQEPENQDTKGESNGEIESPIQESEIEAIPCEEQSLKFELSPQLIEEIATAPTEDGVDQSSVVESPVNELKADDNKDPPNHCESSKVIPPLLRELVHLLIELLEIQLSNGRTSSLASIGTNSIENLEICGAHKVFVEVPLEIVDECYLDFDSFEPSTASRGLGSNQDFIKVPFDRGKSEKAVVACFSRVLLYFGIERDTIKKFVFDPGGIDPLLLKSGGHDYTQSVGLVGLIKVYQIFDSNLIFDPGIHQVQDSQCVLLLLLVGILVVLLLLLVESGMVDAIFIVPPIGLVTWLSLMLPTFVLCVS